MNDLACRKSTLSTMARAFSGTRKVMSDKLNTVYLLHMTKLNIYQEFYSNYLKPKNVSVQLFVTVDVIYELLFQIASVYLIRRKNCKYSKLKRTASEQ